MFSLREAAAWSDTDCAAHIADQARIIRHRDQVALSDAVTIAANDAWLDGVGNLRHFAVKLRDEDSEACRMVADMLWLDR